MKALLSGKAAASWTAEDREWLESLVEASQAKCTAMFPMPMQASTVESSAQGCCKESKNVADMPNENVEDPRKEHDPKQGFTATTSTEGEVSRTHSVGPSAGPNPQTERDGAKELSDELYQSGTSRRDLSWTNLYFRWRSQSQSEAELDEEDRHKDDAGIWSPIPRKRLGETEYLLSIMDDHVAKSRLHNVLNMELDDLEAAYGFVCEMDLCGQGDLREGSDIQHVTLMDAKSPGELLASEYQ